MSRIAVKRALLLLGMLLCSSLLGGCGGSAAGDQIDVAGLQHELETVIQQEKHAEGIDYDVTVACASTATDGLHFSCHVDAAITDRPTQQWTETVSCQPLDAGSGPRCSTDTGYALQ